ncbi:hypothetical protein PR048_029677 [Dryococelus australis]|uniref:DNA-directed DNA polymerase n=1 Tax=Dryococelus australis TaxID=614101 RepID=A0ABQ9GE32_9NEOP|nr:hypothetical protein PR048_029677 [Dryococelus australis]
MALYISLILRNVLSLRTHSKNIFFKLINNSIYGKTLQNVCWKRDIRVVSRYDTIYGAAELIGHLTFQARQIIDENLVLIEMSKHSVASNKPFTCVQNFFCWLCTSCNATPIPLYTLLLIKKTWFDTSNYALYNLQRFPHRNKGCTGVMKDECAGRIFTHFVSLCPKLYCKRCCE